MVNMNRCTACGAPNPASGLRCGGCGAVLPAIPSLFGRLVQQLASDRRVRSLAWIAMVVLFLCLVWTVEWIATIPPGPEEQGARARPTRYIPPPVKPGAGPQRTGLDAWAWDTHGMSYKEWCKRSHINPNTSDNAPARSLLGVLPLTTYCCPDGMSVSNATCYITKKTAESWDYTCRLTITCTPEPNPAGGGPISVMYFFGPAMGEWSWQENLSHHPLLARLDPGQSITEERTCRIPASQVHLVKEARFIVVWYYPDSPG